MSNRNQYVIAILALGLILTASGAAAGPEPVAAQPGVEVDVQSSKIQFTVPGEKVAFVRVEVFDEARERIFDSGPYEGLELDWDLTTGSGELAEPGVYVYVVQAWDAAGNVLRSQVGKVAVAPETLDFKIADDFAQTPVQPMNFDVPGDFAIFGRLGVGTDEPARAVHLQGRNAVFRMDRDVNSAAFLMVRTAQNDFDDIWGTFVLGVNADGPGSGEFIINDLGASVAGGGSRRVTIDSQGQFGINTTDPSAALEVTGSGGGDLLVLNGSGGAAFRVENDGDVFADGSYNCGLATGCFNAGQGADVAERIDSVDLLEPGDVVEIDVEQPVRFRKSAGAMSRRVAGVISTAPAITLGNDFDAGFDTWRDPRPLLALAGRVPVKVTAEPGAIAVGDLLVSSGIPGHAMRCAEPSACVGAVIGKALQPLSDGESTIEVQVMLR